jgi:hypothetical protein
LRRHGYLDERAAEERGSFDVHCAVRIAKGDDQSRERSRSGGRMSNPAEGRIKDRR